MRPPTSSRFWQRESMGTPLPKQHGAPLRLVVPWKYGFKSIKSIVKIEFTAERPRTFWNSNLPREYDFVANVRPGGAAPALVAGVGKIDRYRRAPRRPYLTMVMASGWRSCMRRRTGSRIEDRGWKMATLSFRTTDCVKTP